MPRFSRYRSTRTRSIRVTPALSFRPRIARSFVIWSKSTRNRISRKPFSLGAFNGLVRLSWDSVCSFIGHYLQIAWIPTRSSSSVTVLSMKLFPRPSMRMNLICPCSIFLSFLVAARISCGESPSTYKGRL